MADTLVERVTGQSRADAVPVEVSLVMAHDALVSDNAEPAVLEGYGPLPAPFTRAWLHDLPMDAEAWVRRLYEHPLTGCLVTMDSRRRGSAAGTARCSCTATRPAAHPGAVRRSVTSTTSGRARSAVGPARATPRVCARRATRPRRRPGGAPAVPRPDGWRPPLRRGTRTGATRLSTRERDPRPAGPRSASRDWRPSRRSAGSRPDPPPWCYRLIAATVARVTLTRSAGASPRSSPRRPPET